MSYAGRENSGDLGEPIELYEFVFPNTTYRYCTDTKNYTIGGFVWKAESIKRQAIKTNNTKGVLPVPIEAPLNFLPSILFKDNRSVRIPMKIYRTHRGDTELFLHGSWYLADVSFNNKYSVLRGASISNLLQSELPRHYYQFQCNHELYSVECGVTPVTITGTILSISTDARNLVISNPLPLEAVLGAMTIGTQSRMMTSVQGGNNITLLDPFDTISVGDTYTAHDKGCDRAYQTCINRFANGNNFGGMPFIPKRNVFNTGV